MALVTSEVVNENKYAALMAEEDNDECTESCCEGLADVSGKRSTAMDLSVSEESFPTRITSEPKRKKKKMKRWDVTRTKTDRKSKLKTQAPACIDGSKSEEIEADGRSQSTETPTPVPESGNWSRPARKEDRKKPISTRWRRSVCTDASCADGCKSEHDQVEKGVDDSEESMPGMADSDSEDEIPDTPDHVLSAKQLDARVRRRDREKLRDRRAAREKIIDAENERISHQDPGGSSVGLPLTADDARHDRLQDQEFPRVGRGETHQSMASGFVSIDTLLGKGAANASNGLAGMHLLYEKRGVLNAVNPGWEKLTLTVDSGASDTVVPPTVCSLAPLVKGPRYGIEYEAANGETVDNMGERDCLMKTGEIEAADPGMEMKFQVVDVSKALLSVNRVCEQGHEVLFSKREGGSAILVNGDPKKRIPLRNSGGTYELDVWVKPNPNSGFSRPR